MRSHSSQNCFSCIAYAIISVYGSVIMAIFGEVIHLNLIESRTPCVVNIK